MNLLTKIAFMILLPLSIISTANSTTIKLNDSIELGVLSLNESFKDFYDYRNYSSHTGYEVNNGFVLFFAEYENNLALFALAGSDKSKGKGKAKFRIADMKSFGSIIFQDDNSDKSLTNGVNWAWNSKKNDGLIFKLNNANNFDLDMRLFGTSGLGKGYQFLSFDNNNQITRHKVSSNFNVSAIPEPTTIAVMALGLIALVVRRRKA